MRQIEAMVPRGKRDSITEILDDEGIDYVMTEKLAQQDPSAIVSFPVPTPAVESILDRLREVRAEEDAYTVVTSAETVVPQQHEDLEARYEQDNAQSVDRIGSAFDVPGIGPLIEGKRVNVEVRHIVRQP